MAEPLRDLPPEQLVSFLSAIQADYGSDVPRLVFADWLEDHDDPRAELTRIQYEKARLPEGSLAWLLVEDREKDWLERYHRVWPDDSGEEITGSEASRSSHSGDPCFWLEVPPGSPGPWNKAGSTTCASWCRMSRKWNN
jgi:uncharacterized protein (TIGR02996 family)